MEKIVVIKFRNNCKPYYFSKGNFELKRGQGVIVETSRGLEYGTVAVPEREIENPAQPLKPILRVATKKDEETLQNNLAKRGEAMKLFKEKAAAHNLTMKLIDCEFTFDGTKVVFYFSAEGRVDFRELVKDLAGIFHIRIELRQVGSRDETRILGGIAPCGRECCCAGSMADFKKVGIKMAKTQGLSLNPGKISGLCGRLMCCLAYENDYYASVYKKMPKIGGSVNTPEGHGTVVTTNMLNMTARVKIEKDGSLFYRDYPVSELSFRRGPDKPEKDDDLDKIPEE